MTTSLNAIYEYSQYKLPWTKIAYGIIKARNEIPPERIMMKFKQISKSLSTKEKKDRLYIYNGYSELNVTKIASHYLLTFNNRPLLQHYIFFNIKKKEKFIYFYHYDIDRFKNAPFVMLDGTCIDRKGTQIVLVGAKKDNKCQIVLAAVCNSKNSQCYYEILSYLVRKGVIIKDTIIVSDFEMAILSVISRLNLKHSACYFHYCKAIRHQSDVYTKLLSCVHRAPITVPQHFTDTIKYMLLVPFEYRQQYFNIICKLYAILLENN